MSDPEASTIDDAILRAQAAAAQAAGRRAVEPRPETEPAGFVTRLLAFAIDVAVVDVVALATGAIVALAASFFDLPGWARAALLTLGGIAYVLWSCAYFATFWSTTGQTPGSRAMGVRVIDPDGDPISPLRALRRLGGMVLAALPFFAGYALILIDRDRRAFQDRLAGTVVVYAPRSRPETA